MKTCRSCGAAKPLGEFYRASKTPDGRQYRCKACTIAAARQRAIDNPEHAAELLRKHRQTEKYKARQAAWREAHAERIREQKRASYQRNRAAIRAQQREYRKTPEAQALRRERYARWRQNHPRAVYAKGLEVNYSLTLAEFDAMVIAQSGRCLICNEEMLVPNVDHDHETGAVRGLLCHLCNRGLGLFRDRSDFLQSAIRYLDNGRTA